MTAVSLGLLTIALGSMVLFRLTRRDPDPDATRKGSRFFLGVLDFLLHWFLWVIGPLERGALRLGMSPSVANAGGLVFGAVAGVLIALGSLEAGGWAIAFAGICDVLDGRIARARQVASSFGKFIDSTLDRFVEAFAFLGFVYYLRGMAFGPLVAAGALSGSLLVSYAQARGETVGVSGSGGLMQRAERLALSCLVCLFDPPLSAAYGVPPGQGVYWVIAVIALGSWGTAIHRTLWIARRLR